MAITMQGDRRMGDHKNPPMSDQASPTREDEEGEMRGDRAEQWEELREQQGHIWLGIHGINHGTG